MLILGRIVADPFPTLAAASQRPFGGQKQDRVRNAGDSGTTSNSPMMHD
jgi:hypothetical protein